jgi:hypothetical protein
MESSGGTLETELNRERHPPVGPRAASQKATVPTRSRRKRRGNYAPGTTAAIPAVRPRLERARRVGAVWMILVLFREFPLRLYSPVRRWRIRPSPSAGMQSTPPGASAKSPAENAAQLQLAERARLRRKPRGNSSGIRHACGAGDAALTQASGELRSRHNTSDPRGAELGLSSAERAGPHGRFACFRGGPHSVVLA